MTKRRGNGEGSIYRRKDGLWCGRLTIGHDQNGKRVRKAVYGKTKRETLEKVEELKVKRATSDLATTSETVGEWLERWLETGTQVTAKTLARYEGVSRLHIVPFVGHAKLAKFSADQIDGLYARLRQLGRSDSTISHVHRVLRRALNVAVRRRLIPHSPIAGVDAPRVDVPERAALDPAEARVLLEHSSDHRLHALFVLAVTTGMRMGELFGLKWTDIDFDQRLLRVNRTIEEVNAKLREKPPKTRAGRREINLPTVAIDALCARRKLAMSEGLAACELVFPDTIGGYLRRSNFARNDWKPIRDAAGLPPVRFHDLRHTCASLLLSQGVPVKVVQERLGHAQIAVTLQTYSHLLQGMQQDAAAKLDGLLSTG